MFVSATIHAQMRPLGKRFATRSEVIAAHAMAATSQPLATQIALDILKKLILAVVDGRQPGHSWPRKSPWIYSKRAVLQSTQLLLLMQH